MASPASSTEQHQEEGDASETSTVTIEHLPEDVNSDDVTQRVDNIMNKEQAKKEQAKEERAKKAENEERERMMKLEADFRGYLMSKYFSDKDIFGGNIFDMKMNAEGETVKSSMFPGYQSYLDPAHFEAMRLEKDKETGSSAGTAAVVVDPKGESSTKANGK